jgi:hypothetical protein
LHLLPNGNDHLVSYCYGCPIKGEPCRGETVRRLCHLTDPFHPGYQPSYLKGYRKVLPVPFVDPSVQIEKPPRKKGGCCGDVPMPG